MDLLLDTHTFLWSIGDTSRLSRAARTAIRRADVACYVSLATWWEIGIKMSLGKLKIAAPLDRFAIEHMAAAGFQPLGIRLTHVARVATLPFHHRDPFDRLLAAQALEEGLSIVSTDTVFEQYTVPRLW